MTDIDDDTPPATADLHGDDIAFIRALSQVLRDADLSGVKVERDGLKVRLDRRPATVTMAAAAPSYPPTGYPPLASPSAPPTAAATPARPASDDLSKHPGCVKSPMVGTAYTAPDPDAKPFVSVGDSVKVGQTVLIIEAMKTMNQIPSTLDGKVTRILVADGDPVEYGAPLLIVE